MGLQTWTTLFNNFAVDVAKLGGDHVGMIQSIRGIPGFLALLAVFVIRFIPEHGSPPFPSWYWASAWRRPGSSPLMRELL